jgi:hypothetical protein
LNFIARKTTDGAQTVWKTENEDYYTNFTVERSSDGGLTYEPLGGLTSDASGTYSFLDKYPPITTDMYRLKIEDLNGAVTYSNVITLIYGNSNYYAKSNINVYPNPANGIINLTISPGDSNTTQALPSMPGYSTTPDLNQANESAKVSYDIKITNITGSVVKTANSSSPAWQYDISPLSPGAYLIQVVNHQNNSVVGSSTFIKM